MEAVMLVGEFLCIANASWAGLECKAGLLRAFTVLGFSVRHRAIILCVTWPPTFSVAGLIYFFFM